MIICPYLIWERTQCHVAFHKTNVPFDHSSYHYQRKFLFSQLLICFSSLCLTKCPHARTLLWHTSAASHLSWLSSLSFIHSTTMVLSLCLILFTGYSFLSPFLSAQLSRWYDLLWHFTKKKRMLFLFVWGLFVFFQKCFSPCGRFKKDALKSTVTIE